MKKETQKSKISEETVKTAAEDKAAAKTVDKAEVKAAIEFEVAGVKIGPILREARLKEGKKLPDIAQSLCIRQIYLEAIEASKYDSIPEFPYGLGFIRSYADYLGLDSAKIVQMYKTETEDNRKKDEKYYVLEPQMEATVPSKKYLLISLLAIMAVYFAWFLFTNKPAQEEEFEASEAVVAATEQTNEDLPLVVEDYASVSEVTPVEGAAVEVTPIVDVTGTEESVNTPQVVVKEGEFVEPKAEVKPEVKENKKETKIDKSDSRVVINVKKETWVEVKDANKLYISKVLSAGDTYRIPTGAGMILSVGRADGVEVLVDGKVTPVVTNVKKMGVELDSFLNNANH